MGNETLAVSGVDSPGNDPGWHRASACTNAECVEVAFLDGGRVALRDSKDPDGPVLSFDSEEWTAFVTGVRAGELAAP